MIDVVDSQSKPDHLKVNKLGVVSLDFMIDFMLGEYERHSFDARMAANLIL